MKIDKDKCLECGDCTLTFICPAKNIKHNKEYGTRIIDPKL